MPRSSAGAHPTCHPDRPYYARGLCRQCYRSASEKLSSRAEDRRSLVPLPRVHPDRTTSQHATLGRACECAVSLPRLEDGFPVCMFCSRRIAAAAN